MTEPLPRLADALTEVSHRLRDIGIELRALQNAPAAAPASSQPAPAPQASPGPAPAPQVLPYPPTYAPAPLPHYPSPPEFPPFPAGRPAPGHRDGPARPTLWDRLSREGAGSLIVAWVGGAVTLAGVVLLLVLAIQRGYIGPLPRVLLGAALGAALVGIGLRLHRHPDGGTGAHALVATGIAVAYLDTVGATAFYRYLPAWAGLASALAVVAAGVAIAYRWDSQLLATFAVLGSAISAPVLTKGFAAILIGFLLALQAATTPVQLRKRWGTLAVAAAAPTVVGMLAAIAPSALARNHDATTVAVLCLVTSVVQLAVAVLHAMRDDAGRLATGLALAAPVPTLVSAVLVSRPAAVGLIATMAALYLAVWVVQRAGWLRVGPVFALAAAGAGTLAAFEAVCLAFRGDVRAIALLGGGLLLAVAALRLGYPAALRAAGVFAGAGLVAGLPGALDPDDVTRAPSAGLTRATVLTVGTTGALMAVTALVFAWVAMRIAPATTARDAVRRWVAAAAVALYGVTLSVLSVGLAVSPDRHGFLIGHVLVTISWTVFALVLLLRFVDSPPMRVAGLTLVGAALAKLVLFDLSSLSGIPRVLAFLGAGLVLLAAGARYAKLIAERTRPVQQGVEA